MLNCLRYVGLHGVMYRAAFGKGRHGNSYFAGNLYGGNDQVVLGNGAMLNPSEALLIAVWVNAAEIGRNTLFVERCEPYNGSRSYALGLASGKHYSRVYHGIW